MVGSVTPKQVRALKVESERLLDDMLSDEQRIESWFVRFLRTSITLRGIFHAATVVMSIILLTNFTGDGDNVSDIIERDPNPKISDYDADFNVPTKEDTVTWKLRDLMSPYPELVQACLIVIAITGFLSLGNAIYMWKKSIGPERFHRMMISFFLDFIGCACALTVTFLFIWGTISATQGVDFDSGIRVLKETIIAEANGNTPPDLIRSWHRLPPLFVGSTLFFFFGYLCVAGMHIMGYAHLSDLESKRLFHALKEIKVANEYAKTA